MIKTLATPWLLDDQAIACDPQLVAHILDAVDVACEEPARRGTRNRTKTHAIIYATPAQVQAHQDEWDLPGIRQRATLNNPIDSLRTVGATLGGPEARRDTFKARLRALQAVYHTLATLSNPAIKLKLATHCICASEV